MRLGATKTRDIQSVAVDWVIRLDRGALSEVEQAQLTAWLDADSRNRGAFARAQAMWVGVRGIAAQRAGRMEPAWTRRVRPSLWRIAAAIVAIALIGGGSFAAVQFFAGREVAGFGEVRRIALEDGSTMILNTSSAARMRFNEHERRMVLLRGEASFLVAKHDPRPFIVQARNLSVRAVGTNFVVRMLPDTVSVTVDEGVVEIARAGEGNRPPERRQLSASRQLTAAAARPIETASLSRGELTRQLAWRDGLLIFDGELLKQATDEVNRYSNVAVEIDDSVLQNKPVFGVFRTGDTRAFAYAVAELFNARVSEEKGSLRVIPK